MMEGFFTKKTFAVLILVLFCTQYIPIESRNGVSMVKLAVSLYCPIVFLFRSSWLSKAFVYILLYYALVIIAAISHPDILRWSTVLFFSTFLATYVTYYNMVVVDNVFTKEFFKKFLRSLIIAYFVVIVLQHLLLIIGVSYFPLLNLTQNLNRGIAGNSLSYEPSSAAVTLSFTYLSLIRLGEFKYGRRLAWIEVWNDERWATIGFIYTMFGLMSGTAMVALSILVFYFIEPKQYWVAVPLLTLIILLFFNVDYLPLNRARDSFLAFLTLDNKKVGLADDSSAVRIIPFVNTLTNLDLLSWEGWFGHGTDYGISRKFFSNRVMIGNIADYGFLSFIFLQFIVYKCMIKHFFSFETLLWVFLGMMTLNNVPVNWGAMMIFTTIRHFQTQNEQ